MLSPTEMLLIGHARTPKEFAELWRKARTAAQSAAELENAKLGDENRRGFDCGFAWVNFPGNTAFARWAKKHDVNGNPVADENHGAIAGKHYPSGCCIWYSRLHSVPTQSVSVHEAAARAARDVLAHGLQSSEIYTGSRLD